MCRNLVRRLAVVQMVYDRLCGRVALSWSCVLLGASAVLEYVIPSFSEGGGALT